MSHFTVLVIGENQEAQLQPFHEFECTGTDDQYVQDVDITKEARKKYTKDTVTKLKDKKGKLHNPYHNKFFREPTLAESKKVGIGSVTLTDGLYAFSKDWGDGKGYRPKIRYVPENMKEVEVPRSKVESFKKFVADYYGYSAVSHKEKPDLKEKHKYGYIKLNKNGEVLKVIDRTNPNDKWDWYVLGGRWSGFFQLKNQSGGCNQAKKGEIDFDAMKEKEEQEAAGRYDKLASFLDGEIPKLKYTWKEVMEGERFGKLDISEKRAVYHAQEPLKKIERLSRDQNLSSDDRSFLTWLEYEDYLLPRSEFIEKAGRSAISTFAVILDGKWYARGEMGWWAAVSGEKEQDRWNEEFAKLLDSVSDDTLLSIYDCHI